jgi:hypothetical protein
MRPGFHRDPDPRQIGKPLLNSRGGRSKPPPIYHFTIFVERAVMAPDIPKVNPDRHPDPGTAAWYFRDEMLRWLFHGHSLSDSKDLLIPVFGKNVLRSFVPLKFGMNCHQFEPWRDGVPSIKKKSEILPLRIHLNY